MILDHKVTQLITTWNRGPLLRNNFQRLVNLTLPDEIIVVDDGSDPGDNTALVCDEFKDHLPLKYIYNHNPGHSLCSLARNIGFRAASHDYVITCEPELVYVTDIVRQFKELQGEYPSDIISAGKVWFAPNGWTPQQNSFDVNNFDQAGDYTPPTNSQSAIGWVAPFTAMWKKEWVIEVGGWDEQFPGPWGWDDIDLLTRLRIKKHGQHISLDCQAIHQYHGIGGDSNFINEKYWKTKSFHQDENDPTHVVANKDIEWGKLKLR